MENVKISQKDYLKKYLSSSDDAKKKKKKKPKVGSKTVKIIDDDVDLKNMRPIEDGEFEIFNSTEDAPQIVGVVDERGPVDFTDKRRWKIIADDGDGNVAVSRNEYQRRDMDDDGRHRISSTPQDQSSDKHKISKKSKEKKNLDNRDYSPPRKSTQNSDSDLSPPRTSKHKKDNHKTLKQSDNCEKDLSSARKSTQNSDSDLSPPRTSKHKKDNHKTSKHSDNFEKDLSSAPKLKSKRKKRKKESSSESSSDSSSSSKSSDSSSDLSLPRKSRRSEDKRSKRRRGKRAADTKTYDSDLSPPRALKKRYETNADFNNDSKRSRHGEFASRNCEISSGTRKDSDTDLSPPRRSKNDKRSAGASRAASKSPVRTSRKQKGTDSDLSPPRISNKHSSDAKRDSRFERRDNTITHDRQRYRDRSNTDRRSSPRENYRKRSRSPRKPSRWTDERARRSKSAEQVNSDGHSRMKKTLDGKAAGLQDARSLRVETEAHKKREADLFKQMSADVSGVGQAAVLRDRKTGRKRDLAAEAAIRQEKEKRQEEINEKYAKWGKGLKQVEDRADKLERDLYEMSKPLARYADDADLDKELREVERDDDPMLAYTKQKQIKEGKRKPERPSYQGSYMPNRFSIKPGHRWDGVDRSNGYEKKWFEAKNARAALQDEAYKWSTADM